jgi:hypothetical protein
MLELKVRSLTARQVEFLRRWDAEDDGIRSAFLRITGYSPIYARDFDCVLCDEAAYEYVKISSDYPGLWLWNCFCANTDCRAPGIDFLPFTAWTGWKIDRRGFVPLERKMCADITRLEYIVPEDVGGEVVWRRGIATFRTIMQARLASLRDVRRLGWLQILRGIAHRRG